MRGFTSIFNDRYKIRSVRLSVKKLAGHFSNNFPDTTTVNKQTVGIYENKNIASAVQLLSCHDVIRGITTWV